MSSPSASEAASIETNLRAVRERVRLACLSADRDPASVRLVPVTKTVPADRVRAAWRAGVREVGENKVQEARAKAQALADLPLRWVVIGHLQTNKVKYVARFASEFQALDSLRVAEALERRLEIEDRTLRVSVQINTSGEASKFGILREDVVGFVRALEAFPRLEVSGLMTLAVFDADDDRVRACFVRLRQARERVRQDGRGANVADLSMGMSSDFEIAIEEGATTVRIGQAIFGPRPLPDSHYWPTGDPNDRG